MAITEHDRHRMYQRLEEVLGREEAATLMEHLPPVGWADVATKRDLDHLRVATKRDIDDLRVATKRDIDDLRLELESQGHQLRAELESQGHQLRAELERGLRQQFVSLLAANTALAGVLVGGVLAAVNLG